MKVEDENLQVWMEKMNNVWVSCNLKDERFQSKKGDLMVIDSDQELKECEWFQGHNDII